jgi:aldehyde:ferredoxin oxidoreductase
MVYGHNRHSLVINLSQNKIITSSIENSVLQQYIGGRGRAIRYLFDNLARGIDPLSPDNILVISLGPLTGTLAPSSARYTVAAKSPLTGGIGYANAGGHFAPELSYAGYDAIFIHGCAETPVYLLIDDQDVDVRDAQHLWGSDTWETDRQIKHELQNENLQIASIGQGGENLVRYAAIINNHSRAAARTGLGAVMGSKNLKAIVVRGTGNVDVAEPENFTKLVDVTLEKIYADPTYPSLSHYGTPFLVDLAYISGGLATRNNQTGIFERYEDISAEVYDARYRVKSESCFGCPIHCGKYVRVSSGPYAGTHGGGPEYETIVCVGSKCGVSDLAAIIYINELCNRFGLDTISIGDTIAFAMEAFEKGALSHDQTGGLDLSWGNIETVIDIIRKVASREGLGNLLAKGVQRVSEEIGKNSAAYALHVKGMEPPAYDVRTAKGFGLGWATATRGADHLAALPNFELLGYAPEKGVDWFGSKKTVDPYAWEGKPRMVIWHENFGTTVDSAEMCKYTCFSAYAVGPEDLAAFLTYAMGRTITGNDVLTIGERIFTLERLFNLREGLGVDDDRLPDRFTKIPLPEGPAKGQVVELDKMLPKYYELREWDYTTGYPKAHKLRKLRLLKDADKFNLVSTMD